MMVKREYVGPSSSPGAPAMVRIIEWQQPLEGDHPGRDPRRSLDWVPEHLPGASWANGERMSSGRPERETES